MNIVVLGHLVLDEIHTFHGTKIESLGGIYFPLGTFDAIANQSDIIAPVFPVGNDAIQVFSEAESKLKYADVQHCYRVREANTRVRLFHDEQAQYNTQLVASLPTIPFEKFQGVCRGADLIYVNMMTGDDISVSDFGMLRKISSALVFLDIHMIAYKVGQGGHRETAQVERWLQWIEGADIVQCNDKELSAFSPCAGTSTEKVQRFFDHSSLQMCIVTRGSHGADIFTADGDRIFIPPSSVGVVVDSTGCGDVFGSTFAYHYVKGYTPGEAGLIAAKAASFVLSLSGAHGLHSVSEILGKVAV